MTRLSRTSAVLARSSLFHAILVLSACGDAFSGAARSRDGDAGTGGLQTGDAAAGAPSGGKPVGAGGRASGGRAGSGGAGGRGSGGDGSGGDGSGGDGAGGIASSGGRVGAGGVPSGVGGACGPCPGYACSQNAIRLQVSAKAAGGVIGAVSVKGSGLTMTCQHSGCTLVCTSSESRLSDGRYTLSIAAQGYATETVNIDVVNPTNCGCCGCCPFSATQNVALVPDGSTISGCCSDLQTDPTNCGTCGKKCEADAWCAKGACTPVYAPCVGPNDGFATCTDYCKSLGKACSPGCGPSGTESIHWWGQGSVKCGDTLYSSNGTCSDRLSGFTGARCCCS
jgi:hypothetical protein